MDVVLKKIAPKGSKAMGLSVVGRLVRPPRKGSMLVIEFPDGLHEYVTTPIKRILKVCGKNVYYIQTVNSRYRLEIRSESADVNEAAQ